MQTLIVTGGIATGKSAFCRTWQELEPGTVLNDADAVVHALYAEPEVRRALAGVFGSQVLVGTHDVDRAAIRKVIFAQPERRAELEGILHPRVRQQCAEACQCARLAGAPWFIADIPLFFETGGWRPDAAARVVVVACAPQTQLARLLQRNPFDNQEARRIINAQADLSAKMAAADHVVWNEGLPSSLRRQARMLRASLQSIP